MALYYQGAVPHGCLLLRRLTNTDLGQRRLLPAFVVTRRVAHPGQIPGWHRSAVARADSHPAVTTLSFANTRSSPSPPFVAELQHVVGNAGVASHRPRWDYNKQRRRYHNVT